MTSSLDGVRDRLAGVRATLVSYVELKHDRDVWENRVLGARATALAALDRTRGRTDARELQDCLLDILAELERTPT